MCQQEKRKNGWRVSALITISLLLTSLAPAQSGVEDAARRSAGAETINVSALLEESRRNGILMRQRLSEYTFIMNIVFRWAGTRGTTKQETRTYEIYGTRPGKQPLFGVRLEKDGAPTSPDSVEKERLRVGTKMEKAARENPRVSAPSPAESVKPGYFTWQFHPRRGSTRFIKVSVTDFLEHCQFHLPRRTHLRERDAITLDFRSCSNPPDKNAINYLSKVAGRVWFDVLDKVVVRLEAWPLDSERMPDEIREDTTRASNGGALVYEQTRTKEGVWVPSRVRVTVGQTPSALFEQTGKYQEFDGYMSDYKWFDVEVEDEQMQPLPRL